jgi:hypothetical protein
VRAAARRAAAKTAWAASASSSSSSSPSGASSGGQVDEGSTEEQYGELPVSGNGQVLTHEEVDAPLDGIGNFRGGS